jgi:two-component system OmpR family response regulator
MSKLIAIVEDEQALAQNYQAALEREDYRVQSYADRPTAQAAFGTALPDLAIIDIQLGDDNDGGHDLCRYLRGVSATLPIIFLTARDSEIDEVVGFTLGADDYLTKGITMLQLTTRVSTLLKRTEALLNAAGQTHVKNAGALRLDTDCLTATWDGQPLVLTVSEYLIVSSLVEHPGHVKSRQQLMDAVDKTIEEESVNSYIKRIRKKIKDIDAEAKPIRSEHSLGYRWVVDSGQAAS